MSSSRPAGYFSLVLRILIAGLLLAGLAVRATTLSPICVDAANTHGPWNGSAAHPFAEISDAISSATTGSTVYVAQGKYYGFTPLNKMTLLGGFPHGNFSLTKRNPAVYPAMVTVENPSQTYYYIDWLVSLDNVTSVTLDGFSLGGYSAFGSSSVIYCHNLDRSCKIVNCTIAHVGLGYMMESEGVFCAGIECDNASPQIIGCVIEDLGAGGDCTGVRCYYTSAPFLDRCRISNTYASGHDFIIPQFGMTVHVGGNANGLTGNAILQNCVITGNTGTNSGDGVYGGYASSGSITNCTIAGNDTGLTQWTGAITNCIIWGNSTDQVLNSTLPTYSCIQNWTGGGTGNIVTNPQFIDADALDYRLRGNSPCIDAGMSVPGLTTDYFGNRRPVRGATASRGDGSRFDIGAIEYGSPRNAASPAWRLFR